MNKFPIPSEAGMLMLRTLFADSLGSMELLASIDGDASVSIAPSRLYAYATGAIQFPDEVIETALGQSPALRQVHRQMVSANATYRIGEAMAASEDSLLQRSGEGCSIRFEASKGERGHFYVIVELVDPELTSPQFLIVYGRDDVCHRFPLPAMRRGVIQFMVSPDDEFLALMRDPEAEIFLR